VDGVIYAAGGFWDGPRPHPDPHPTTGGAIAFVEYYDIETNKWTESGTKLSAPRTSASGVVVENVFYICGGEDDAGNTWSTMEAVTLT
tara:strand:- start:1232 stop:1495 length:264 start_codon:yes stop_codon:yes gene_type:complete